MAETIIVGVGFILFNQFGQIFSVRELVSKPQYFKEAGMVSFPFETQEKIDKGDHGTIKRMIQEEMDPRFEEHIKNICPDKTNFQLIPGRSDITTRYQFAHLSESAPTNIEISDPEVEFAGWLDVHELVNGNPRVETVPILNHLFEKHFSELPKKMARN